MASSRFAEGSIGRLVDARLPRLRLSLPLHNRWRGALVPQRRPSPRGRGPRRHLPHAPTMGPTCGARRPIRGAGSWTPILPLRGRKASRWPPGRVWAGVLFHLLRHRRRYDVVHTASFPYFSLLAAGLARSIGSYEIIVDWHEVWTREYWEDYLGPRRGRLGWLVQRLCMRIPQRAFCFSRLHERRLRAEGILPEVTVLRGQYDGPEGSLKPATSPATVVYVGRHIPEKRVPAVVDAVQCARTTMPDLHCAIFGDGPERATVLAHIERSDLAAAIDAPGFVTQEVIEQALSDALCLVLPSRREGYGLVVVEAASRGTPSVVVEGADNAATELIDDGVNGFIASSAEPLVLAEAIAKVERGGERLRESTLTWFEDHRSELDLSTSLDQVVRAYPAEGVGGVRPSDELPRRRGDATHRVLHVLPHPGRGGEAYVDALSAMDSLRSRRVFLADDPNPRGAVRSIIRRAVAAQRAALQERRSPCPRRDRRRVMPSDAGISPLRLHASRTPFFDARDGRTSE